MYVYCYKKENRINCPKTLHVNQYMYVYRNAVEMKKVQMKYG